jgi:4-carboxymuconolactone decarboxylase
LPRRCVDAPIATSLTLADAQPSPLGFGNRAAGRRPMTEESEMDHTDVLRLLAINGAGATEVESLGCRDDLDAKSLALVRLAALIAVGGGAGPSYGEATDAAVSSGASAEEVVAVLLGVVPVVGMARVVAAAPKVGMALGYDTEAALE